MAEINVPPVFRAALDEPAPPPPPDVEDEGDDDGEHVHIVCPAVTVWADGSITARGWTGSALIAWFHVASAVTIALALWAVWNWLGHLGWGGFRAGLLGGVLTAGLLCCVVVAAGVAIYETGRVRRLWTVTLVIVSAVMLGWVISDWWMS